jgi:osmotically-inducible protein OsmY
MPFYSVRTRVETLFGIGGKACGCVDSRDVAMRCRRRFARHGTQVAVTLHDRVATGRDVSKRQNEVSASGVSSAGIPSKLKTRSNFMKTTHLLKAAGSIACVVFALNVSAQTTTASGPADTSMGQKVDDSAITTKVKAELLGAKNVKSTHIHVKTVKGVVNLTGTVPSAEDKSAAEEVVANVSGVASVKNHLKIAAQ